MRSHRCVFPPRNTSCRPTLVGALPYLQGMRRAYLEAHCPLPESFKLARRWAGPRVTVIASSTSAIEASGWLPRVGLPLGVTSHRRSRYTARPVGTVIAWCLDLEEILDIESVREVAGVVSVRAFDQHRPWVTAHQVEHLGGHELVSRVVSDFTVWFWDNPVCLLLPRWCCVLVMSRN